jgi:hypothetical protein
MNMRRIGSYTRKKQKKDGKQKVWNSMRWLGTFTLLDIVATAEVGEKNALKYLRSLEKCGYVRRIKDRRSGFVGGNIVWRLAKNTGPLRPLERKDGTLFDPNTGDIVEAAGHERGKRLAGGSARSLPANQPGGDCQAPGPVGGDD